MSEPIMNRQLFNFKQTEPFEIYNIRGSQADDERLLNHWHEELEMVYCLKEHKVIHYINGEKYPELKDRLIITNSNFVHNIVSTNDEEDDEENDEERLDAVVIIIGTDFIQHNFPQYENLYFTNEKTAASKSVRELVMKLSAFAERNIYGAYDHLLAKGVILQLLYEICKEGVVERNVVDKVNVLKDIERIKGVIQHIEQHYMEHMSQKEVAKKFYFEASYFSRFFKKCIGVTFSDYLIEYRLKCAKKDLLYTDKRISAIALDHGFSDDRRFILAFKKKYGTTPLQYRKREKMMS